MAGQQNMMSLRSIQMPSDLGVFTPIRRQPIQQLDDNAFANAMAYIEQQKLQAGQAKNSFNSALSEVKAKLANDDETNAYFNRMNDEYNKQIENEINSGNYINAINKAGEFGSNFAKSKELRDRVESYNNYTKAQEEAKKMIDVAISKDTYDWWAENNKYSFNPSYDNSGKYISGNTYNNFSRPLQDVDWTNLIDSAFKMVTPTTTASSNSHNTNAYGTFNTGSSTSTQSVTKDQIQKNLMAMINSNPLLKERINQQYSVERYKYDKIKKALDNATTEEERSLLEDELEIAGNGIMKNNAFMSLEDYLKDKVYNNPLVDNKVLHNTETHTTSVTNEDHSSDNHNRRGGGTDGYEGPYSSAWYDNNHGTFTGKVYDDNIEKNRDAANAAKGQVNKGFDEANK